MNKLLLFGATLCASIAGVIDVRSNRIPNWLTYTMLVAALITRVVWGGWPALKQGLGGVILGGGIFLLFFLVRGMGAGDVKLMAAVGAFVGIQGTVTVLIGTAFAGGVLALLYMVFYRRIWTTIRNLGVLLKHHLISGIRPHPQLSLKSPTTIRLPYGLAIALGTLYLLISTCTSLGVTYGH